MGVPYDMRFVVYVDVSVCAGHFVTVIDRFGRSACSAVAKGFVLQIKQEAKQTVTSRLVNQRIWVSHSFLLKIIMIFPCGFVSFLRKGDDVQYTANRVGICRYYTLIRIKSQS